MKILEYIRTIFKIKGKRDFIDYIVISITVLTFLLIVIFQIRSETPSFDMIGENIEYEYMYALDYSYFELVNEIPTIDKYLEQYSGPKNNEKKSTVLEWILYPQVFKLTIINKRNSFSITDYYIDEIKLSKEFKNKIVIDYEIQDIYLFEGIDFDYQPLSNNAPINVGAKETKIVYALITFPILFKDNELVMDLAEKGRDYKNGGEITRIQKGRYDHGVKFSENLIDNSYCVKDIYINFCNELKIEFELTLTIDNNKSRKSETIKILKK